MIQLRSRHSVRKLRKSPILEIKGSGIEGEHLILPLPYAQKLKYLLFKGTLSEYGHLSADAEEFRHVSHKDTQTEMIKDHK